MPTTLRHYVAPLCVILLALLAAISVARGVQNAWLFSVDLENYYDATRIWLAGESPYGANAWVYLPQMLLVLAPFCVGSFAVAKASWAAFNVVLLVTALLLCLRAFATSSRQRTWLFSLLLIAVFAGIGPVRNTIGNGQAGILMLATLVGAVLADRHDRRLAAGVLLSLALTKWSLTAPFLLYFVVKKRFRTLGYVVLASTVFFAIYLVQAGQAPWVFAHEYLQDVFSQSDTKEGFGTYDAVSFQGRLSPMVALLTVGLVWLGALALLAWRAYSNPGPRSEGALLAGCAVFVLAVLPHLIYDLMFVIIPLAFLWLDDDHRWRRVSVISCVAIAAYFWVQPFENLRKVELSRFGLELSDSAFRAASYWTTFAILAMLMVLIVMSAQRRLGPDSLPNDSSPVGNTA